MHITAPVFHSFLVEPTPVCHIRIQRQPHVPVEMNGVLVWGYAKPFVPRADKRQHCMGDTVFAPFVNVHVRKIESKRIVVSTVISV